jgi:hypothetical protein
VCNDRSELFSLWPRGSWVLDTSVGSELSVTLGFELLLHLFQRFATERIGRPKDPVTLRATETLKVLILNPYHRARHGRSISLAVCKREHYLKAATCLKRGGGRSIPQKVSALCVQDCTSDLKICRTTGVQAAMRSAKAHAMPASEEGSTVNYKLNCLPWHKPSAEVLLETDSERLLTILAATEMAVFQRLCEFAPDQDASALFCAPVAPRCSVRS